MKHTTLFMAIIAMVALFGANVDAQKRTPKLPGQPATAAPVQPTPNPAQLPTQPTNPAGAQATVTPPPATTPAALNVTIKPLPAIEAGRTFDFTPYIQVAGGKMIKGENGEYYHLEMLDGSDFSDNSETYRNLTGIIDASTEPGPKKLNLVVKDGSDPALEVKKELTVNVVPFVPSSKEIYDYAKTAATRQIDIPQPPSADEVAVALLNTNVAKDGANKPINLATAMANTYYNTQPKEQTFMQKYGIGIVGFTGVLVGAVLGLFGGMRIARNAGAVILVLMLPALAAAQTPNPAGLPMGPATGGTATPAPANSAPATNPQAVEIEIASSTPKYLVAGETVTFVLKGKNLDRIGNLDGTDEFKFKTKKDSTDVDIKVNAAKTQATVVVTVDKETEGGFNGFKVLKTDGTEHAQSVNFTVIDSDIAAFVRTTANSAAATSKKTVDTLAKRVDAIAPVVTDLARNQANFATITLVEKAKTEVSQGIAATNQRIDGVERVATKAASVAEEAREGAEVALDLGVKIAGTVVVTDVSRIPFKGEKKGPVVAASDETLVKVRQQLAAIIAARLEAEKAKRTAANPPSKPDNR